MFAPIANTPRDYAWGRPGAISGLLGWPPSDAVEAELWFGAHHGSPSSVIGTGESLMDVAPDLPFLLKILAAGSPLSLQAHPNEAQAREGFDRENAVGVALDAPHRNYKDSSAKPELIVALSPTFEALAGFRPAAESADTISRIADRADARAAVAPLLDRLRDDATAGSALIWLLRGGPHVDAVVDAVARGLQAAPAALPYATRIAELHEGDAGIVGALLLHHVVLARGEGLYLGPGSIHAYLDGVGIELMAPSDNVLRGGLTVKHVDVAELARILDPAAGSVPTLDPVRLAGGGVFYAPEDPQVAFSLARIDASASIPLHGPAIALCTAGTFTLRGAISSIDVTRGDAVFVTPDERRLEVSGAGSLYLAR